MTSTGEFVDQSININELTNQLISIVSERVRYQMVLDALDTIGCDVVIEGNTLLDKIRMSDDAIRETRNKLMLESMNRY